MLAIKAKILHTLKIIKNMRKNLSFVFAAFALVMLMGINSLKAQVTTGSITGTVTTDKGEGLIGATVTATHTPSGTVYTTVAKKSGTFNLPGVRVGGPYSIKISFVGLETKEYNDVYIQLGDAYGINAVLGIKETQLGNVEVVGARGRKTASERGGMSAVINNRQLTTLPTLSRSITDFTSVTPQANGNYFGGRDARYNNITVDGANLNNNFGLDANPLPGSGNNPISLDAVEEVSVSLAPFDVRQGTFTGANIAAITKSGTNEFHGSAFTYWQNQGLEGWKVAGVEAAHPAFKSRIFGASLGGPIIKNKLFFFINGEYEKKPPQAGITFSPTGGSNTGNISSVTVADLQAVSDYLKNQYNYDPGAYDNFPAFKNDNYKILAKVDWNISTKHKLTVKYSDFKGTQDFQPSQSGSIGSTYGGTPSITYGPKFSNRAMGFSSTLYQQQDIVKSGSLELNSNFTSRISNQFLITYTQIKSDKTHSGATFPFIDILKNYPTDANNYISVGNEPFNGNNNKVHNNIFTITDNFSYFVGKHSLTAGISYEHQFVGNMFMRGGEGYYLYASVSDFINNANPLKYAQTYSLIPGQDAVYSAQLKIGQMSAYVQDEININPNFKLTAGIRMDKPIFPQQPLENPANSALTFQDIHGNAAHFSTGNFPKPTALFSPRVGFRWDILGDKSLILRGGTGLFTGRIPYVYLTNIPTNSGMYQYSATVTNVNTDMSNYKFNPDPHAYNPFYNKNLPANIFPTTAGSSASTDFVVADPKYKFPQVWRTNLAIEKKVNTWKFSLEAMYTKDVNATYMYDANLKNADGTIATGPISRPYYTNAAARRINSVISGNAIVLASSSKGNSFIFTASVEKQLTKGLSASLAYTYTSAKNLTENPGSQANSTYQGNATAGTLNDLQLAQTSFALPHRLVGIFSYHVEYFKHLGTTISLVWQGSTQGRYSYVYNGSVTNQGYASANLMYIPRDATNSGEIQFVDHNYTVNGTTVTYTAAQQAALFEAYIKQDPYLSKHRGEVAARNGAKYPWYNSVNVHFAQDLFTNIGKDRNSVQFTIDLYNALNFLSNRWGVKQFYTVNNQLVLSGVNNGVAQFYMNTYTVNGNALPVAQTFVNNVSTTSTWGMQMGLRYNF